MQVGLRSYQCLAQQQCEFGHDLITMVDDVLPQLICAELVARIGAQINNKEVPLIEPPVNDEDHRFIIGPHQFFLFTGNEIKRNYRELIAVYHSVMRWLALITLKDVCASSYDGSDINFINAKAYPPGGGNLPPHIDSNAVTCLLQLTTNTEGALHLQPDVPGAQERVVLSQAGRLLLMQGRRVRHWVDPLVSEGRITVCMNYWVAGDTDRTSEVQRKQGGDWDDTMRKLIEAGMRRAKESAIVWPIANGDSPVTAVY